MTVIRLGILVFFGLLAGPASAECLANGIAGRTLLFDQSPPEPPDPALRPIRPECLRNLSGPEQENCPRDELAAFGREVDVWVEALNAYVIATNRFANEAAVFANSAIEYARLSRQFADSALEFANCEAAAIASPESE